jgi:hypothetical protein
MSLRMGLVAVGALAFGCQALPDVVLGSCGNYVIEPGRGEDCDNSSTSCGAPSDSVRACRLVCSSVVACPAGWACGSDQICRQPTGAYVLGPPITTARGTAGNLFGVADVDGDAVPDLIVRGPAQVSLYRNDGTGQFQLLVAGSAPSIDPATAVGPQVVVPRSGTSLLAAFGSDGVALSTWQGGALDPLVLPTTLLPKAALKFVGVGLQPPNATPVALFIESESSGQSLVAFALGQDLTQPVTPLTAVVMPDRCLSSGRWVVRTADLTASPQPKTPPPTLVAFAAADACVARFDGAGQLALLALTAPPATPLQTRPALADIDGDGHLDVVVAGQSAGSNVRVVWLQGADGSFGPPVLVPSGVAAVDGAVGVANFAGHLDTREDLVSAGRLLRNQTSGSGSTFAAGAGFVPVPQPPGADSGPNSAAGDLNGDGKPDYVVWGSGFSVCFAGRDGTQFTCAALPTSLSPTDTVLVGDVNGDSIDDVIAEQSTTAGAIQVLLGRYLSALDPVAVTPLAPSTAGLGGAALWPAEAQLATQLAVYVPGAGLANGVADANGVLSFDYPIGAIDVAFVSSELWIVTDSTDGGHLLRFPGLLPAGASDTPLGVPATGARLFALGPAEPLPVLINASPATPWIITPGATDSAPVTILMLPAGEPASTQLLVDLDGDGIAEILQERTFGSCGLRVLHWSTPPTAGQPLLAPAILDTSLPCFLSTVVMDVPPFDGRPDLVASGLFSALLGPTIYPQQPDFTFTSGPGRGVQIIDGSIEGVDATTLSEIATVDLNGDGLIDLVALTSDSTPHAIIAQVKRR